MIVPQYITNDRPIEECHINGRGMTGEQATGII